MCGGGGGSQTVTQKQEIPGYEQAFQQWQNAQQQSLFNQAQGIYNSRRNFPEFNGQRVAGFTPDQFAAFQQTRATQGDYLPTYENAIDLANTAAGANFGDTYTPGTISTGSFPQNAQQYMSPYVKGALDTAAGELDRRFNQQQAANKANQAMVGAFGDRADLVNQEAARNHEQDIGNLYATGLENAYNNAANVFNADQSRALSAQTANENLGLSAFNANRDQANTEAARKLQAAQQMAGLSGLGQSLNFNDINALYKIGAEQQGLQQQLNDVGYQTYLDKRNYPIEEFNFLQSALHPQTINIPMSTSTTKPGPSTLGQVAGLGLTGLGLAGMFGAFGPAAIPAASAMVYGSPLGGLGVA